MKKSDRLVHRLGSLLVRDGKTLATAESCTGGMIAKGITDVSGSSRYFAGGVVSYSNEAKMKVLGVGRSLIAKHGAVSREVAAAMARGVRRLLHTDCAIAVTGIAGPGGGTPAKPVGLVYISVIVGGRIGVHRFLFRGNRDGNRKLTTDTAINLLINMLDS